MILLVNPWVTRPRNRRFSLSVMSVGAAFPPHVSWEGLDGNVPHLDPLAAIGDMVERQLAREHAMANAHLPEPGAAAA